MEEQHTNSSSQPVDSQAAAILVPLLPQGEPVREERRGGEGRKEEERRGGEERGWWLGRDT